MTTTRHKSNNNKENMGIAGWKRGAKVHLSTCSLNYNSNWIGYLTKWRALVYMKQDKKKYKQQKCLNAPWMSVMRGEGERCNVLEK